MKLDKTNEKLNNMKLTTFSDNKNKYLSENKEV